MSYENSPNTIFFTLKLKRGRTPAELFEKISKSVKKKGATKNWSCTFDTNCFSVDFGDEISETFCLSFDEKKVCNGFCKVNFPLDGELFNNEKKSEFKALLNMIWSGRKLLSQMDINDDYGLAKDYMDSKKYKLSLRELTPEETAHIRNYFDSGITSHPELIMAIVREGLEIPDDKNRDRHINPSVPSACKETDEIDCMWAFWETYVYETMEYKGTRVMDDPEYDMEFSGCWFTAAAFSYTLDELYRFRNYFRHNDSISFGVKHGQIRKFYKDKVYPLLDTMPDGFEKCCIAYRFFLSAQEFCGLTFVGKYHHKGFTRSM